MGAKQWQRNREHVTSDSCLSGDDADRFHRSLRSVRPASGHRVHVVARTVDPVRSDRGLVLVPTVSCDGVSAARRHRGSGRARAAALMDDETALGFVRRQAAQAKYVTSVCTGALVLGAAGLLCGYRATTHWLSLPLLRHFDAIPVDERVVVDRNRVTARVAPLVSTWHSPSSNAARRQRCPANSAAVGISPRAAVPEWLAPYRARCGGRCRPACGRTAAA